MNHLVSHVNRILNDPNFDLTWSAYHQRVQYHNYSKAGFSTTTCGSNVQRTLNYFLFRGDHEYFVDDDMILWSDPKHKMMEASGIW